MNYFHAATSFSVKSQSGCNHAQKMRQEGEHSDLDRIQRHTGRYSENHKTIKTMKKLKGETINYKKLHGQTMDKLSNTYACKH